MGLVTRKSVDELTAEAHTDTLRRTLGPFSLPTLGGGALIGAGIAAVLTPQSRLSARF